MSHAADLPTRAVRQRGASMLEFAVVGPIITLLGLATLEYGLLFVAKSQIDHATFMAARAGSMGHADLAKARQAYARALIPLYGGGLNTNELTAAHTRAVTDIGAYTQIALLNPTRQSFDDWSDPALQDSVGGGQRVIPNASLAFKDPARIRPASGQNIQDANLIKIRITHGYRPKTPFIGAMYSAWLKWADSGTDAFQTRLIDQGRIPVVSYATLQMHSDAIEGPAVLTPGAGNDSDPPNPGNPGNPHDAPVPVADPPACPAGGCNAPNPPATPVNAGNGGDSKPDACPDGTIKESLPADPLFDFGKSTLSAAGKGKLDELIALANTQHFESVQLTGYTDPLGDAALNDTLSLNRANAVRDYLQAHGFPDKPITTQGRGAQDLKVPLAACPASGQAQIDCLAPNRRVEVTLQGAP